MAFTSDGQENLTLSIPITKATEADDGTLYVEGLCTDDGLDLDQQIISRDFAVKGLTDWFSDWANVRQQHSSHLAPAGKAVKMEVRPEGVWIRTHVVEPTAIKLVKEGVYQAYSVGISQPRIIRDPEGVAKNGRVVDGIFSEVSLVDFPANPRAKFQLAKRASSGEVEIVEKAVEVELTKAVPTPADVFGGKSAIERLQDALNEIAPDGHGEIVVKRDIPDKERDKIPAEDFAGPDETYPIVKPEDVASAAHLVGKADDPEAVKAKIIAIAKRKGPDFVAELPESWTKEEKSADAETKPVEADLEKAGARDCTECGKSYHADSDAKYCADCGKKLPAAKAEKSAEAEVVAPEAPAEAEPAEGEAKVEKSETPEAPVAESVEKSADVTAGPDPSAFTPGSSAWEAADAAKASEAVQGLIALRSSIRDLAAREQAEGDDQENVWNLNDAAFAVDSALAVLARFAATEQAEASDAAAAGKGLEADLTKSLDAVRAELVKFAPAAEVEALRADLTAEREARETLEKRLAEIEKSPDPHSRAYRGAPLAALRPKAEETGAGTGDADAVAVKALEATIMKARSDIGGVHFEKLMKQFGPEVAAKLVSD